MAIILSRSNCPFLYRTRWFVPSALLCFSPSYALMLSTRTIEAVGLFQRQSWTKSGDVGRKKIMVRRKERKGKARNVEEVENDKRWKKPHCCDPEPSTWCRGKQRVQSLRQCWFNHHDITDVDGKESLTMTRKFDNDKESLTVMRSLLLIYKESSMQIPVDRNPSWPKKWEWSSRGFQTVGKTEFTLNTNHIDHLIAYPSLQYLVLQAIFLKSDYSHGISIIE